MTNRNSTSAKPSSAKRGLDVLSTSQTDRLTRAAPRLRTRKGPYLVDQTKLGAIQAQALASGGITYSPWDDRHGRVAWLVAGKGRDHCVKPVVIVLNSGESEATAVGSAVELHVRCRKCEPCQRARRAYWKIRAIAEVAYAPRTWFLTLTWNPASALRCDYQLQNPAATGQELFAERAKILGREVTKYLQRVRKGLRTEGESRVAFRYLMAWEPHDSEKTAEERRGFPHCHLLIHETAGHTVTKRRLQREWQSGISDCKLVDTADPESIHRNAAYVCKYITKRMAGPDARPW